MLLGIKTRHLAQGNTISSVAWDREGYKGNGKLSGCMVPYKSTQVENIIIFLYFSIENRPQFLPIRTPKLCPLFVYVHGFKLILLLS